MPIYLFIHVAVLAHVCLYLWINNATNWFRWRNGLVRLPQGLCYQPRPGFESHLWPVEFSFACNKVSPLTNLTLTLTSVSCTPIRGTCKKNQKKTFYFIQAENLSMDWWMTFYKITLQRAVKQLKSCKLTALTSTQ